MHVSQGSYLLQGGIVRKEKQFKQKGKPMLLTIEDPQQPGTDIGSGAFNIGQVGVCTCQQDSALTDMGA